jgi:hypothetical protein
VYLSHPNKCIGSTIFSRIESDDWKLKLRHTTRVYNIPRLICLSPQPIKLQLHSNTTAQPGHSTSDSDSDPLPTLTLPTPTSTLLRGWAVRNEHITRIGFHFRSACNHFRSWNMLVVQHLILYPSFLYFCKGIQFPPILLPCHWISESCCESSIFYLPISLSLSTNCRELTFHNSQRLPMGQEALNICTRIIPPALLSLTFKSFW